MKPQKNNLLKKIDFTSGILSRILLIFLILILIGVTIWISGPIPEHDVDGMILTPTVTALVLQAENNKTVPNILETTATSGVLLSGLGVVLIILVGTFISIKSQK